MTRTKSTLLLILCLSLSLGCARHAPAKGVDYIVSKDCLLSDVHLEGCNTSQSPPVCKTAKIKYRKGCEALVIRK